MCESSVWASVRGKNILTIGNLGSILPPRKPAATENSRTDAQTFMTALFLRRVIFNMCKPITQRTSNLCL